MQTMILMLLYLFLAGCGSVGSVHMEKPNPAATERTESSRQAPPMEKPEPEKPGSVPKKGGYYLDDGPGESPPPDIDAIPNAIPRYDPPLARANRPYTALGMAFTPMTEYQPYKESGIASWYGKRYHGQKTSSGEPYDMYGMTAAHATLPIPSYVQVTNLENGRSVVVRVNDRGPFHPDRLIDLSYAAAYKLRLVEQGSGRVQVESIDPRAMGAAAKNAITTQPETSSGNTKEAIADVAVKGGAYVQLGAFKQRENADQLRDRITRSGLAPTGQVESWYNEGIYRVRLGPFGKREDAEQAAAAISRSLGLSSIVTTQ